MNGAKSQGRFECFNLAIFFFYPYQKIQASGDYSPEAFGVAYFPLFWEVCVGSRHKDDASDNNR